MKALVLTPTEKEVRRTDFRAIAEPDHVEHRPQHRTIAYLWALDDTADHGKPAVNYAKLTAGHDKDRKRFYASIRQVKRAGGYGDGPYGELTHEQIREGLYVMEQTSLFDQVTVFTEPVARFGAKAHAAFAEKALDALRLAVLDRHGDIARPDLREKILGYFGEELYETTTVATVIELDPADTLTGLQEAVGGYIEPLVAPDGYEAYGHDEAKLIQLPKNPVATAVWEEACDIGEYGRIPGDYIAGPVVFVGPLDDEGDTTGLTDTALAELLDLVELHGATIPAVA